VIGSGGIFSAEDVLEKFDAGAVLVQLYTGFVYEGPPLIGAIRRALVRRIAAGGDIAPARAT
jgi:dihydroorotate dehydrogenase